MKGTAISWNDFEKDIKSNIFIAEIENTHVLKMKYFSCLESLQMPLTEENNI